MDDIEYLQEARQKRLAKRSRRARAAHKRNMGQHRKEDHQSNLHDISAQLNMVENVLTTPRGSKKRSKVKEKRPTNISTWFNEANSHFNSLMATYTAFAESKNENLCCGIDTTDLDEASTCATSKNDDKPSIGDYGTSTSASTSVEDRSESDKSSDENYSTSTEEDISSTSSLTDPDFKIERSKKVYRASKNYSGNKSKRTSKDYSRTPRWSSDRCEC